MSEATTLEATPSEASTLTTSDDSAAAVSSEELQPTAEETTEPGAETVTPETPEPVTPPRPRSIAEIRAAISDPSGSATGAELQQLQRYEQSARDVQANIERRRTEHQTALTAAQSLLVADVEAEFTNAAAADRNPDMNLIRDKMGLVFGTLGPKAEAAALSSYDARLDSLILEFADNDVNYMRELVSGKSFAEKVDLSMSLAYQLGQRSGPGDDMVVETKAERAAAIQAAVNAAKAGSPTRGTSVGGTPSTTPNLYNTKMEARVLHADGKISNTEMRRALASALPDR